MKNKRYWRMIFNSILGKYAELHSIATASGCSSLYLDKETVNSHRPEAPNLIDFLTDVELAARQVLNDEEFIFYKKVFQERDEDTYKRKKDSLNTETFRHWESNIKEKVGKILKFKRIHPMSMYMNVPASHYVQQCKCGNKAHTGDKEYGIWCAGGCKKNMMCHDIGRRQDNKVWCIEC